MSSSSTSSSSSASSAPSRPLLMIPGPIEFHPDVLAKLAEPTPGHVSAGFIAEFSSALKLLRDVFIAPSGQPLILSGSGTLGWEIIAANLLESSPSGVGADVLVVNTGYFSDSWVDTFDCFGLRVVQLRASVIGGTVSPAELIAAMEANPSVKLVALTQVDTSTAVLNDIRSLSAACRASNPNILVAVDGVCSIGGEQLEFDAWGIDAAMTCSQKALGCPPGLCVMMLSPRAIATVANRTTRIPVYYGNLNNWLPIMRAYESLSASYFATPNVNLIRALNVSLKQIVNDQGVAARFSTHAKTSAAFKSAMTALGLRQVPTLPSHAANTLSAIYFPTGAGVDASKLLPTMVAHGIVAAGGLHRDIKATYFRVGHMSYSIMDGRTDVLKVVAAIEAGLTASGYKFTAGAGADAYMKEMQ